MTRILLTGSTGFIGRHIVHRPEVIRSIVRQAPFLDKDFYVSTIDGNTDWTNAFEDVDVVLHLAGLAHRSFSEGDYNSVNVEGTIRLATQARSAGVKRIVYLSSVNVHGQSSGDFHFSSTSPIEPFDNASQSKSLAEKALQDISLATGLEVVIVRSCLVFGVNAPANVKRLVNLVRKSPLMPFSLVNNQRSVISVGNLVDLLICCARHPDASGHIFYASDGPPLSTKALTNILARSLDKKIIQLPIPAPIMKFVCRILGYESIAESLLGNLVVDSSSLHDVLGWNPPNTFGEELAGLKQFKVEQ